MAKKILIALILLTTYSCQVDRDDGSIFDPILTSEDLTVEMLIEKGFKKVISDTTIFYIEKDDFREIKYETERGEIIGRTFRFGYEDLDKFLKMYDGEIIEPHFKDNFLKFRIREQDVTGEVTRDMEGTHIEIITDWFHIIMH